MAHERWDRATGELKESGVWIPERVYRDDRLLLPERVLYGRIVSLSKRQGYCFAKNGFFAEELGVSERRVQEWIANLIRLDYVERELRLSSNGSERRLYPLI